MKTQQKIKKASVLFVLIIATNAVMAQMSVNIVSANENPKEKIFVQLKITPQAQSFQANVSKDSAAMKFKVQIANPEEARVVISIKSENGGYYFSKRLSDAWYAQTYDFSNVEDGLYTIEIEKGKNTFRKSILITTKSYSVRTSNVY